MLKIKYLVIINGRVISPRDLKDYADADLSNFISSTVQYANEYNFAYDNLIRKIDKMIYSASINGILITRESIKFYAGRRKNA